MRSLEAVSDPGGKVSPPGSVGRTILRGVVGSTAYGLATPESDVDRLAVHMAPIQDVLGFGLTKGQETVKTVHPDLTSHDVAKFLRLLLKGNPTVQEALWLPEYEVLEPEGEALVGHRSVALGAAEIRQAYGGYAMDQLRAAVGKEGFSADTRNRTNKHARHCFRLLLQGTELLRTGNLRIRLTEEEVYTIRYMGDLAEAGDFYRLKQNFASWDTAMDDAYHASSLPEHPDRDALRDLLVHLRLRQLLGR